MGLGIALAGLGALMKAGTGIYQGIQANKIDKNNIRPYQNVQSEYTKNVADAENMARGGLPQQQYLQSLQNIQRNQSGAINTLSRSSNPTAGLNALLRASNDATMNLDTQDAIARQNNQRNLMQQRGILGQQKQNAFDWNEKSKYLAQAAKAQALRGAGGQNLAGAFGDVQQMGLYSGLMDSGVAPQNTPNAGMLINPTQRGLASVMPKYIDRPLKGL